jgi:hypothetical protein
VVVTQKACIARDLARRVNELVLAMGLSGSSSPTGSRLCKGIDERVCPFLDRPLSGDWS